ALRQVGAESATHDRGLERRKAAAGARLAVDAPDPEAAPRCSAADAPGPAVLDHPLVAAVPARGTDRGIGEELAPPHVERRPDRRPVAERLPAPERLAPRAAVEECLWTDIVGAVAAPPAKSRTLLERGVGDSERGGMREGHDDRETAAVGVS